MNITDVDDKLIEEAKAQGCTVPALAEKITGSYLKALELLGVHGIDQMPKASEHIGEIVAMCRKLIEKKRGLRLRRRRLLRCDRRRGLRQALAPQG